MKLNGYSIDIMRAEQALTVIDLANKSGCSASTIQKARQGKDVAVMAAGRIAKALGVSVESLAVRSDEH